MNMRRKSCGGEAQRAAGGRVGQTGVGEGRRRAGRRRSCRLRARFSVPTRRWNSRGAGGSQTQLMAVVGGHQRERRRRGARTRQMMALSTSASSGLTTSSRSASVLDGAICSSGTSSPVLGSRYCTRLWWLSSSSSSTRTPVARSTSMTAQAQNAWSSSRLRSLAFAGVGVVRPRRCRGRPCGRWTRVRVVSGGGEQLSGRDLLTGAEQGLSVAAPAVGGCDEHRQHGQPFAGAGVHARLAAALGLAPVDLVLADRAGRDPRRPAAGVLQRPLGQVEVERPDRGQAFAVAESLGFDLDPLAVSGDRGGLGAQPPLPRRRRPRGAAASCRCRGGGVRGRSRSSRPGRRPVRRRLV